MRKYYYLVASLPDVILQGESKGMALFDFLEFCEMEMHPEDFKNLKMMYLFNDIKNVVFFKKEDDVFVTPSFYSKEEFIENFKDPDYFFPFIADYLFFLKTGKRFYPAKTQVDELTQLFYENIDEMKIYDFIKKYYVECELVLTNLSRAMVLKFRNSFDENKLINYGDYYERIVRSNNLDFGMQIEFPFLEKLSDALNKSDFVLFEELIERARWDMLDRLVDDDFFSVENVFAIGKKLESVNRWKNLNVEKGKAKLEELVNSIKAKIAFPPEFQRVGGRKK
ncbi:MAG: DUF2764 domain-containing protein [Brevinematales bacterium]|nr:DUF2764 domain-containing protein [Brevinematales bacterium]